MRVIFWAGSFWPYIGGIETFSMRLLPALAARGHEITVVTSDGSLHLPDRDSFRKIPVCRFPFNGSLVSGDIRSVRSVLKGVSALKRKFRPHLIHVNMQDPSIFFHIHTSEAWPAPTLLTVHGEFRDCSAGADTLLGRAFRSVQWVNAVSQAMLSEARALVPEITSRSSLIYNASPIPQQPVTRASVNPPRLVCMGRHVRDKGFDIAIQSFTHVLKRHREARLIFASDGPERPALEKLAEFMGISQEVEFRGWLDEKALWELIDSATAVIVPSRWREGFGLVALEAALRGRAVVGTRVGGLPEVIVDGVTGLLVDKEDPDALSQAVCRLLDEPDLAADLGNAAYKRATQVFDFEAHVAAYEALYVQLAGGKVDSREPWCGRSSSHEPSIDPA